MLGQKNVFEDEDDDEDDYEGPAALPSSSFAFLPRRFRSLKLRQRHDRIGM